MPRHLGASFQHDNARHHTARKSLNCLHAVNTPSWSAWLPDLSPIEPACTAKNRYSEWSTKYSLLNTSHTQNSSDANILKFENSPFSSLATTTYSKFDEAHFWLNGYVNKQNCRIWSEANPQVYVETPLHPEKLTVWCALWAGGILLQKR
ncbi:hypothetical protein TNCV_104151 [Trichonephila clavipes]|nr:hypothetical protein TNCV_104151 [Trichonephila clavipes]